MIGAKPEAPPSLDALRARVAALEAEIAGGAPLWTVRRRVQRAEDLLEARSALAREERIAAARAISQRLGALTEQYETLRLRATATVGVPGREAELLAMVTRLHACQREMDHVRSAAAEGDEP